MSVRPAHHEAMNPGALEFRWARVIFLMLAGIDVLIVWRAVHRIILREGEISPDAPLFLLLLLGLQILLVWLYGRLQQVIGYYRRLQASHEQELDFARQIMENSNQGMLVLDEYGRFVYANSWVSERLGLPKEQLLGRVLLEFVPPEQHAELIERWQQNWGKVKDEARLTIRDEQGRLHDVLTVHSPRWFQGRVVGYFMAIYGDLPRLSDPVAAPPDAPVPSPPRKP